MSTTDDNAREPWQAPGGPPPGDGPSARGDAGAGPPPEPAGDHPTAPFPAGPYASGWPQAEQHATGQQLAGPYPGGQDAGPYAPAPYPPAPYPPAGASSGYDASGYPAHGSPQAGYPAYGYPGYGAYPPARRTNTLAIVSLVCSVLGFTTGLTAIAGIVCGHMALSQIRRTGEEGRSLAIAGLVIGYGVLAIGLVLFVGWLLIVAVSIGTVTTSNL